MKFESHLLLLIGLLLIQPLQAAHEEHPDHEALQVSPQLVFADVLQAALQNAPRALEDAVRSTQAESYKATGSSWLAGRPSLNLSIYDDGLTESDGLREQEVGLQLPVWRPGERQSARQQGQHYQQQYEAWQLLLNWEIAGAVRRVLGQIEQAQLLLDLEQQATGRARQALTAGDKLLAAGAISRLEFLQVQNLLLEQQQKLLAAEAVLVDAEREYSVLTGLQIRPAQPLRETLSGFEEVPDSHPLLAYLRSGVDVAYSAVKQSEISAKGSPQLSIGTRRERADKFQPYLDSVAVSVNIPIGGKSLVSARTSNARREQVDAEVELLQSRRHLQQLLHEAEHELYITRQALPLAEQQADLATQRREMAQSAFAAGELLLNQFLSAIDDARQIERSFALLLVREQHLISEFNQYAGVLP